MDTLNLILSNLHWYILATSVLVYAVVRLIEARAASNPARTWEDVWAPTVCWLAEIGARGVDLLADYLASKGDTRLKNGQAKLRELQAKIAEWEAMWKSGRRRDAIVEAMAWYVDLQGKAAKIPLPFTVTKTTAPRAAAPSDDRPIGPDDEAVEG